jgi:hypothetical protein
MFTWGFKKSAVQDVKNAVQDVKNTVQDMKNAIADDMTLEQVTASFLQLKAEEDTNHHRMGQLYNYVVAKKLAELAGYKTTQDYFRKKLPDLPYASMRMYGAVAAKFSAQVSVRFGVTCLYLLLTYKEVADIEINHDEPGPILIEVPDENGAVASKPFSTCTVDEMRKAIQRKRKPSSSKPVPPEARGLAEQYQQAVTNHFPQDVVVKVEVRNQKGKAVLDFKGIPVEDVETLIAALTARVSQLREAQLSQKAPPSV